MAWSVAVSLPRRRGTPSFRTNATIDMSSRTRARGRPMKDKRVAFTAPDSALAIRIADALLRVGARPLWMPTTRIDLDADSSQLELALIQLVEYDFLLFLNPECIEGVLRASKAIVGGGEGASRLSASGVKGAVAYMSLRAQVMEKLDLETNHVPLNVTATAISDMLSISREPGDIMRVLMPVPEHPLIEDASVLKHSWPMQVAHAIQTGNGEDASITVDCVPAYRVESNDEDVLSVELELVRAGKVDAVWFSSADELFAFHKLLPLHDVPDGVVCVCQHEDTMLAMKTLGFDVAVSHSSTSNSPMPASQERPSEEEEKEHARPKAAAAKLPLASVEATLSNLETFFFRRRSSGLILW
ncbi:hypothetical protein FVE85_4461 [Porphyridium purpureum]|uniref:Uncharacterized protein n=1 Tax=Porphyridium purpureum TaxID=35688 RepID=A0A5J4YJW3_PORPP|nr:hypothetical protein FVE85_4461 [Porphyridium purpureum]|eukprot:POR6953..scf297_16